MPLGIHSSGCELARTGFKFIEVVRRSAIERKLRRLPKIVPNYHFAAKRLWTTTPQKSATDKFKRMMAFT